MLGHFFLIVKCSFFLMVSCLITWVGWGGEGLFPLVYVMNCII